MKQIELRKSTYISILGRACYDRSGLFNGNFAERMCLYD